MWYSVKRVNVYNTVFKYEAPNGDVYNDTKFLKFLLKSIKNNTDYCIVELQFPYYYCVMIMFILIQKIRGNDEIDEYLFFCILI